MPNRPLRCPQNYQAEGIRPLIEVPRRVKEVHDVRESPKTCAQEPKMLVVLGSKQALVGVLGILSLGRWGGLEARSPLRGVWNFFCLLEPPNLGPTNAASAFILK